MDPDLADRRGPRVTAPLPPLYPPPEKFDCHGCGRHIVYLPARVCTGCLLLGHVTEAERAALEDS